jgi:hypothetical protein
MKKLFSALLLAHCLAPAFAQEPGLQNVSGGLFNILYFKGMSSIFGESFLLVDRERTQRTLNIQPYTAWKINEHSLLGLRLGFASFYDARPNYNGQYFEEKYFNNEYSIGVFTRHYLQPKAAFSFFVEPSVSYAFAKGRWQTVNDEIYDRNKNHEIGAAAMTGISYHLDASVSPGVSYHATKRLGFLVRFGKVAYLTGWNNNEDQGKTRSHDFRFDFSLASLAWGIEYRWGGKKGEQ